MFFVQCNTGNFQGYNLKFSPFCGNYLAIAASENYGISGSGLILVLQYDSTSSISIKFQSYWKDGIYDITWSESNPEIIITAGGDGTIQMWNINSPGKPIQVIEGHTRDVYGVDWSFDRVSPKFLSSSWDTTIKMWDGVTAALLNSYDGHNDFVYSSIWSPHNHNMFASCSSDRTIKLWDTLNSQESAISINAHSCHVLSIDWCKYDSNIIISGGVEGLIRGWDIRAPNQPLFQLAGHEAAVRRVKFSPFQKSQLGSVSYDFTTRFWDWSEPEPKVTLKHHKEFVYGLDFSSHDEGIVADCSWDSLINIFSI